MKNSRVDAIQGGRWRCKLTVSSKFATSTIHGYTHSRVDVGDTNSQCPWSLQRLPYKDTEIQGWTLALQNLQCNLKFARSTIQRYTDSWVDVSVTNLQCPWKLKMSTIQRCKHSRVDVGVTRMQWVRETCKAYHTKIQKIKSGRWRYNLTASVRFAKSVPYKHTKMVDVEVTNLHCPWNFLSLPCKDTKIQGWTLALQLTVSV